MDKESKIDARSDDNSIARADMSHTKTTKQALSLKFKARSIPLGVS